MKAAYIEGWNLGHSFADQRGSRPQLIALPAWQYLIERAPATPEEALDLLTAFRSGFVDGLDSPRPSDSEVITDVRTHQPSHQRHHQRRATRIPVAAHAVDAVDMYC